MKGISVADLAAVWAPDDVALIDRLREESAALKSGTGDLWRWYGSMSTEEIVAGMDARIAEYEQELAAGLPLGHHERKRWRDRLMAERHRRRWGRRLQRIVERPVYALTDLVNRLGGDMYYGDEA